MLKLGNLRFTTVSTKLVYHFLWQLLSARFIVSHQALRAITVEAEVCGLFGRAGGILKLPGGCFIGFSEWYINMN